MYLDADGNFVIGVDLLEENLLTSRTTQKHISLDTIEGTYDIKFVAHKEVPNTDRNKGRICIGEMDFMTYTLVR